ncbi:MAG: hypothetical protein BGN96_14270 [Bacteroidales bacterium 45-6]|nr:MAG: hypothetical protein BGN96_14270 [Bacteroidales bacterium 45-6]
MIAKIKNSGNTFIYTEKLQDFTKLYTQYTIKNRSKLNAFFLQETKGNLSLLFDDFERSVKHPMFYSDNNAMPRFGADSDCDRV